jgi:phage/plasmid-associated DNA primase
VGQFLTDRCEVAPGHVTPVAVLYAAYAGWAKDAGAFVISKKRLSTELTERPLNIVSKRRGPKNETVFEGVKLLA